MSDEAAEALEKPFRDFERQAGQRLRVARHSGFDVAAVELANEADRQAVFDRVLSSRVGPLQDLLRELGDTAPDGEQRDDTEPTGADPSTLPC
jgi:hypothetical protein